MRLSQFAHGRDNNFNLIRIIAAFAVLVTHSFVLTSGSRDAQPLRDTLGITFGSIAVDVFFVTSGFLVTASLLRRQSAIEFLWARVLRIFPALVVMLLLTVFGLGLFFTTTPWSSYLTDSRTYMYLARCSTLFAGVAFELPGVFQNNPYKGAVNGSLWSLPYEIHMYAILVIIWVSLRIMPRVRPSAFKCTIVSGALIAGVFVIVRHFHAATEPLFPKLLFMFFAGAAFFVLKDRIVLSHTLLLSFVLALSLATLDKQVFFVVYTLTLAYLLFHVAYLPGGFIRRYNQLGDYSYGVYIYAFPVQQSIVVLIPGISVGPMVLISIAVTLAFAILSWHFLERHALGLKERYVSITRKLLAYGLTRSPTRAS
jgi:peptidoglycan/LPS O-acetylase OafA/YrhL